MLHVTLTIKGSSTRLLMEINKHERITQRLNKKIQRLSQTTNPSCNNDRPSIFKVQQGLRKNNPEAYSPMLVSIGPYHHENPQLSQAQDLKLTYLRSFLARREEDSVERYVTALEALKHKAEKCYAHLPKTHDEVEDDDGSFVEIMLLDGCFIVEFLRRFSELHETEDDPVLGVDWMRVQICRDLLLLENQLPYFVLSELYDLNEMNEEKESLTNLAMLVFSDMIPKICPASMLSCDWIEKGEVRHLLHLVHVLCRPVMSSEVKSIEGDSYVGSEVLDPMHCVEELEEAGIQFKKIGKVYAGIDSLDAESVSDGLSLFDIKFCNGVMEIPSLKVEDSTETFFRNLIAYEQNSTDVRPKHFTDYAVFMDQLINTDRDVNVLRRNGIIVNLLGDDAEVAALFNGLGDGVMTGSDFYYLGTCKRVNRHCGEMWNVVMAKLRHDYFNSPWASVSTIVAVVLLLLTVIQTVASVIPLLN